MNVLKAIFKENGKEICIEAKRGKPVVDKLGMVAIVKGNFKDMIKISMNVLEEQFEIGECA